MRVSTGVQPTSIHATANMSETTPQPNSISSDQYAGQWFLSGQIDESQPTRQYPIHSLPFSIGRRSDSGLPLQIGCISKNHAEITVSENGKLVLRELGSTNGTFVNGQQLTGEIERHLQVDVKQTSVAFRPLDVTAHPIKCFGYP